MWMMKWNRISAPQSLFPLTWHSKCLKCSKHRNVQLKNAKKCFFHILHFMCTRHDGNFKWFVRSPTWCGDTVKSVPSHMKSLNWPSCDHFIFLQCVFTFPSYWSRVCPKWHAETLLDFFTGVDLFDMCLVRWRWDVCAWTHLVIILIIRTLEH